MVASTPTKQPDSAPEPGWHTRAEILDQAECWQGAIDVVRESAVREHFFPGDSNDCPVLFIGCGSPYYLGMTAAATLQANTRRRALALPGSEVLFNLEAHLSAGRAPLVVAVSRTGETTELVAACRKLQTAGSPVLAITVSEASTLASLADFVVRIRGADEVSLAQTRSFSAMLVATLAATALGDRGSDLLDELASLPARVPNYIERVHTQLEQLPAFPYRRVAFLGSGPRFGLASEAAMKVTEMSLTDSTAFPVLEYRHGPKAMVDEGTLVVGLLGQAGRQAEMAVLEDVWQLGATVLAIAPGELPIDRDRFSSIRLGDDELSESASLSFYLPPVQLLAYIQARSKSLDPDVSRNLTKFVDLSSAPLAAGLAGGREVEP